MELQCPRCAHSIELDDDGVRENAMEVLREKFFDGFCSPGQLNPGQEHAGTADIKLEFPCGRRHSSSDSECSIGSSCSLSSDSCSGIARGLFEVSFSGGTVDEQYCPYDFDIDYVCLSDGRKERVKTVVEERELADVEVEQAYTDAMDAFWGEYQKRLATVQKKRDQLDDARKRRAAEEDSIRMLERELAELCDGEDEPTDDANELKLLTGVYLSAPYPNKQRFSIQQLYVKAIEQAKSTIDFMMYSLDDPAIVQALVQAHKRGVVVRIVVDRNQAQSDRHRATTAKKNLARGGVVVKYCTSLRGTVTEDKVFPNMHLKVMIVDGALRVCGDYNATVNSNNGCDGSVEVHYCSSIARLYMEKFAQLWDPSHDT